MSCQSPRSDYDHKLNPRAVSRHKTKDAESQEDHGSPPPWKAATTDVPSGPRVSDLTAAQGLFYLLK